jgi:hypothetical protein
LVRVFLSHSADASIGSSSSRHLVEKAKDATDSPNWPFNDATDGANRTWEPRIFRRLNFRGCDCIESVSFGPSSLVDTWILGRASYGSIADFTAL